MDILLASEYKKQKGDSGLPLKTVISDILNIEVQQQNITCSSLFEIDETRSGVVDKKQQQIPWLKFSPVFLKWRAEKMKEHQHIKGQNNEHQHTHGKSVKTMKHPHIDGKDGEL